MTEAPQSDVKEKPVKHTTDKNPRDIVTKFIPLTFPENHVQVKKREVVIQKLWCELFKQIQFMQLFI